jgi:hypothetical protein
MPSGVLSSRAGFLAILSGLIVPRKTKQNHDNGGVTTRVNISAVVVIFGTVHGHFAIGVFT